MSISSRVSAIPVDIRFLEDEVLPHINKPARYLGLEQGAFRKSFSQSAVTMAAAFPDLYEIGFSNYGLKLLYSLVNRQPEFMCDRVYAPAPDFKEKLLEHQVPLYGVETFQPLQNFDLLAFSLQYELNYTTIFGMLETAQIPFRSAERDERSSEHWPLLIAGGPGSANPMPLAPFLDAFIIGDGEEVLLEILEVVKACKQKGLGRREQLVKIAELDGLYVPGITEKATKRIVDIAVNPVELAPLIPMIGAVHDRITIEARRGCDRMCRFCQPCFINLPVREQTIDNIKQSALKEIEKTGYEECSLLSLSIADYSYFKDLILEVAEALEEENVSLSLPSQRADRFSLDVAEAVQSVRKSTLTFAPEAGTARLRDVINKNLTDAEIMNAVTTAYQAGWNKVKLYFIIGLPTETHEDLDGIHDIVTRIKDTCAAIKRDSDLSIKHHMDVNVTLSNFVPKPHTPFQWFPQDTMDVLRQKTRYLKDKFRHMRGVKLNFTDPEISKLEAVISRGGAELADVIEDAYRRGAYLDAWDDLMCFARWFEALEAHGIDHEAYTRERCIDPAEVLPWDCVDVGLAKSWLTMEYEKAKLAGSTTPCFETCSVCGVCGAYSTQPKFTETPAKKKKQAGDSGTDGLSDDAISEMKKEPACKLRLRIQKKDKLRFISHLDWLRMIHRSVARARVPVAYSQGFNPSPRVSFGPALPLFTQSLQEYVDIDLTRMIDSQEANRYVELLNQYLPEDGQILSAEVLSKGAPSIDKSVRSMGYIAKPSTPISTGQTTCNAGINEYTLMERTRFLTEQEHLFFEAASGKSGSKPQTQVLDLAPYLDSLQAEADGTIRFRIKRLTDSNGSSKSIKPSWVLGLINSDIRWSVVRTDIELVSRQETVTP